MKKIFILAVAVALVVPAALADTELLSNPGFETGNLSPWTVGRTEFCSGTCVNWAVENSVVHSGTYAVGNTGNIELVQMFAATPGAEITNVSIWANNLDSGIVHAVDFFYTDGSDEEFQVANPCDSGNWCRLDATSLVNPSKVLNGISWWGASPDYVSYFDDASVTFGVPVPEPGSLVLLATGLLGAAGSIRRKLQGR